VPRSRPFPRLCTSRGRFVPLRTPWPSGQEHNRASWQERGDGAVPSAAAATSLNVLLRGDIEEMVLQDLKLTYRLSATSGGSTDLPFLEKLPAIRRLDVRNAEIVLVFEAKISKSR